RVAVGEPRPHSRAVGIGAAGDDFWIALLETPRGSGQRAAATDSGNKRTDLPGGLLPDFRPGGPVVRKTVGGVIELVRPEPALFFRQAPGNVVVVWMRVRLLRHDANLRAQRAQKIDLFSRLGFWNDDQTTVAASVADDRKADAGVPTCPLDDGAVGFQQPSSLAVLDTTKR